MTDPFSSIGTRQFAYSPMLAVGYVKHCRFYLKTLCIVSNLGTTCANKSSHGLAAWLRVGCPPTTSRPMARWSWIA